MCQKTEIALDVSAQTWYDKERHGVTLDAEKEES